MKNQQGWILTAIIVIALGGIHWVGGTSGDASLLFFLSFWMPVVQGAMILVASERITEGEWLRPLRKILLSLYPLHLVFLVLFLLQGFDFTIFPWFLGQTNSHEFLPTPWLSRGWVLFRISCLLILSLISSHWMFISVTKNSNEKRSAVLFVVFASLTQLMFATDWVMSLEYPWISTLFPYFFILDMLIAGVVVVMLFSVFCEISETLYRAASLFLGLTLFTSGMWYAHHLTIWYANIPDELSVLITRFNQPMTRSLFLYSVITGLVVPVVLLAMRPLRKRPESGLLVGFSSFSALLAMRLIYFMPICMISFVQSILLGGVIVAALGVYFVKYSKIHLS